MIFPKTPKKISKTTKKSHLQHHYYFLTDKVMETQLVVVYLKKSLEIVAAINWVPEPLADQIEVEAEHGEGDQKSAETELPRPEIKSEGLKSSRVRLSEK